MLYAIRTGLTLVVAIVVAQVFLPEVAVRLVALIAQVLDLAIMAVDQASTTLPS